MIFTPQPETVIEIRDERLRPVVAGAPRLERLDVRPLLPEVDDLGDGPDLRLWPHVHGTDAMFIALMRKRKP